MEKIVFFFPWKEVSGGPFYLSRLANNLVKRDGYEIYYVDFYRGLADTLLEDYRVHQITFNGDYQHFKVFPMEPITLVMPIYYAHVIPQLHPDSKIVFFNWHNECVPCLKRDWKKTDSFINEFLLLVQQKSAVFFMDKTHQLAQNTPEITFREQYVPITLPDRNVVADCEIVSKEEYNVAILGRLSLDKVYSVIDVIDNIQYFNTNVITNIYVIGDGKSAKLLDQRKYPPYLNVIRCGTMDINDIVELLKEKVDILFAMGTSALEGAVIHLPTVVIPNAVIPFSCNKYPFLYESTGYALGWYPQQVEELNITYHSMREIFQLIYNKNGKKSIGDKCYEYYSKNHQNNLDLFIESLNISQLRYSDIEELMPKEHKVDSAVLRIRNKLKEIYGRKVKRIVLLGIPIITVTQTNEIHFNVHILFLPLLRINKQGKRFSIHILPAVWAAKAIIAFCQKLKSVFRRRLERKPQSYALTPQTDTRRAEISEKAARGEKIRVCLFESRISCWQFGHLYKLLEESGRFEPMVVVIPFMTMGHDAMVSYMESTYSELKRQGYRVVKGYEPLKNKYLNIKEELQPDAVFYSLFWKNHFQEYSYINQFEDIYSFLYPYGFDVYSNPDNESMNFELQNKVTRYYLPTKIHKVIAEDNMDNCGQNVVITGSPKLELLVDKSYCPKDIWKKQGFSKKRVIWAPHHTLIEKQPFCQLSSFLDLHEIMLQIAEDFKDDVQFAFKPHPMLKARLINIWGKDKAEDYFYQWETGDNTQLEQGEFSDLFLTSDAMILDSISFIAEYMMTNKPAFFTTGKTTRAFFNKFGREAIKLLYGNKDPDTLEEDIRNYIDQVVLCGEDTNKPARTEFIKSFMLTENGKTPSENIFDDLCHIILNGGLDKNSENVEDL